jgi:hypothetical protein
VVLCDTEIFTEVLADDVGIVAEVRSLLVSDVDPPLEVDVS